MSIGKKIVKGAAILTSMRFAIRLIGLFSTLILARILLPEDFGLVGLAVSYLMIIEGLAALNLSGALIRARDDSRELYDTAWTLGVIRGLLISIIVALSALIIPTMMNEPRLETLIYIIAVLPFMQGLKNPKFIQFEKHLNYRPLFISSVIAKLISMIATVTIAIIFKSYWALIIGTMISNLIELIISYALSPYKPRATLKRMNEIFSFTLWLSGASILSTLNLRIDNLVVGGFLDTRFVGYYRMGEEFATLPTAEIIAPLTRTFFPAFSDMTDQPQKLKQNALEASAVVAAISFPATCGFAFLAEDIIRLAIGEKWLLIVPMIQILTPIIGLQMIASLGASTCLATGRTRDIFNIELVYMLIRLTAIFIGIYFWGFIGIITARGFSGLIRTWLNLELLRRGVGASYLHTLGNAWRSFLSSFVMIIVLYILTHLNLLAIATWPTAARLGFLIVSGIMIYCGTHLALWRFKGCPYGVETRLSDLLQALWKRRP